MRTFRFPKLVPLLAAAVLSFGVACGDDDDGDDDTPPPIDAATIDAPDNTPDADTTPDAGQPVSTRSGTVAVTDITLVDSAAAEADWFRGAVVTVSYVVDPPVKAPDFTNIVPPGVGCSVTNFNLGGGDSLPAPQDEGAVTITGDGLLTPLAPCAVPGTGLPYACLFGGGATAVGDTFTLNGDNQTATVSIAAGSFDATTKSESGMFLSTTGFTDPTAGMGDLDPYNGAFPILDVPTSTTLVVGFPTAAALPPGTTTGGTFAIASGAGPTPAKRPFLDAASNLMVSKAAGTEVEAIPATGLEIGGDGFRPDDATLGLMRSMPVASTSGISYSCAGAGGTCGTATGTVVSITATNADLAGVTNPFTLPPGANIVSVSCRAFGDTVMVPTEVLDVIEAITPTRIQTTMFRADFALAGNADGTNGTGMVAGLGHTAFGPPAAP